MGHQLHLNVNGARHEVDATENDLLLYVLRNDLNLKGARFGCGAGHCGACTVWMNGRAVQSCDMPLWGVAENEIQTVEVLKDDPVGAVVLQAFVDEQAAQCGYCTNGILLSVAAMLKRTITPNEDDLHETLHRHLCRCGAHVRILRAIELASARLRGEK